METAAWSLVFFDLWKWSKANILQKNPSNHTVYGWNPELLLVYPCLSHDLPHSVLLYSSFKRFNSPLHLPRRFLSKESETSCHHRAANQRVGLANYQSGTQFSSEICRDLGADPTVNVNVNVNVLCKKKNGEWNETRFFFLYFFLKFKGHPCLFFIFGWSLLGPRLMK